MKPKHKVDKRVPQPKNANVSKVMRANKAKNTIPEIAVRKKLYSLGVRGYRLNYSKLPGRPDICFVSKKVAIFINGCFWHRCPKCNLPQPKHNSAFWQQKFEANVKRDKSKTQHLTDLGWKVLTIWGCEISEDLDKVAETIMNTLKV
jgi:DNA mismatch endonuclease (patch repair protein)